MNRLLSFVLEIGKVILKCIMFLGGLLAVCIIYFIVGFYFEAKRLQSCFRSSTYSELVTSCGDEISKEFKADIGGNQLTFVFLKIANPLVFPATSGYPVMVFDEEGILIDKTADEGDDVIFRKKWRLGSLMRENLKRGTEKEKDVRGEGSPMVE